VEPGAHPHQPRALPQRGAPGQAVFPHSLRHSFIISSCQSLPSAFCSNQVAVVLKYNPAGEIVNVSASVVLGPVRGVLLTLEQEFSITFVQVLC